jgi:hypothetical protein
MTTQTLPWYCSKVGGQYGAPLGRRSYGTIATAAPHSLTVAKLPMDLISRDYDLGGAYWGHTPDSYIYCCFDEADGDDGICRYERASSISEAIDEFGIKPEQLNPHPDIHPRPESVLSLDVSGNGTEVDVTTLIHAFANEDDCDALMMSAGDFCLCGQDSKYSWIYAREQVENWHFTDALYAQVEARFRSSGIDGELSRVDLRGMLLQEVAFEYDQWRKSDCFAGENSYATFTEYCQHEDSSGRIYAADDGSYYLSIDG